MSGAGTAEFSRRVALARIGPDPLRLDIAANEAERSALARRFELLSVERLEAAVELRREGRGSILLRAAFDAEFAQPCVVTLDPVEGVLSERFALLYGLPELEPDPVSSAQDEAAFEPLTGDAVDVGEAVAQEFALALPPFPRRPDAVVEPPPGPSEAGSFAALSRLVKERED